MAIGTVQVSDRLDSLWGVQVVDYVYQDRLMDLQDLLVVVCEERAVTIEDGIGPLATRMRSTNRLLEDLGKLLSKFSQLQAKYKQTEDGTESISLSESEVRLLALVGYPSASTSMSLRRSDTEMIVQLIKTKMDALNNNSQTRMTRMNGLVEKRDGAFTSASQMMAAVSDTRKNLISALP